MKTIENLKYKTIFIACDHAGIELKNHFLKRFSALPFKDLGTFDTASVDYPDYAERLSLELKNHLKDSVGILICGSGQGMAIRANRFPFIRAALCWNEEVARLSREHNDANVLCLSGRMIDFTESEKMLQAFLTTPFAGGRHEGRVKKLSC